MSIASVFSECVSSIPIALIILQNATFLFYFCLAFAIICYIDFVAKV